MVPLAVLRDAFKGIQPAKADFDIGFRALFAINPDRAFGPQLLHRFGKTLGHQPFLCRAGLALGGENADQGQRGGD